LKNRPACMFDCHKTFYSWHSLASLMT
jgi:hypothetical protein